MPQGAQRLSYEGHNPYSMKGATLSTLVQILLIN